MSVNMWQNYIATFASLLVLCSSYSIKKFALNMPNIYPDRDELYLCTPVRITTGKTYYITGFQPNATMATAHHILIYGCTKPGSSLSTWNCGHITSQESMHGDRVINPCAEGSQVIYAWAKDAPRLELPEDVGFKVGGDSNIDYLVLQVHYSHRFPPGKLDNSGVILQYTERQMEKQAGVLLLGTSGIIPPHSTQHMETACKMEEKKTIHPFAYRTHTHQLGTVVSGYRVREDSSGEDHWLELGRRSPQTPQMFYPTFSKEPIEPGDTLAARCTMVSNRDSVTVTGAKNDDEMCNFYLMYFVDGGGPLEMKYCFSRGPPYYSWQRNNEINHFDINNIPDRQASELAYPPAEW